MLSVTTMTPSCIVQRVLQRPARDLRCNTKRQAAHWKIAFRLCHFPAKPRQICRMSSSLNPTDHADSSILTAAKSSINLSFVVKAEAYQQFNISRRLSTANTTLEHFQEKVNTTLSANVEDGVIRRRTSLEASGASRTENAQEVDEYLSPEQWKTVRSEWFVKHAGALHQPDTLFESRTMARLCKNQLTQKGRSLMEFVRQEDQPLTYPLMSSYLFLCVKEHDHKELFTVCNWFKDNHSVIDAGVLTNFISGFCQTNRWKESLEFLQDIKKISLPSSRNYHSIISAACDHHDYNLVKELLQEMYNLGIIPSEQICIKLLHTFSCDTEDVHFYEQSAKIVEDLLWYIRSKRTYPTLAVGTELQNWFCRKKGEVWRASMAKINRNGNCRSCGSKLESLDTSEEDFLKLRQQVIEKVIKGGDIFQKTRPDEFEAFMEFVEPHYDIIVDGLNVAHIKQNKQPSKMLRQFVVYLAQEGGLKCLVLGRQHMLHHNKAWNRHHMDAIQDVADCFFTENVSEDDPFMLYATLHSGPKACYVSRDMLRDHKALLDQPTHVAFVKWQRAHQMYPLDFKGGKAIFRARTVHDTVAQHSNSTWHIPCDDGSPRYSYQVPMDWLCAKKVN